MLQADCTSDNEHDDEDDWEAPEGDGHRLEGKVLHVVQLLQAVHIYAVNHSSRHLPISLIIESSSLNFG